MARCSNPACRRRLKPVDYELGSCGFCAEEIVFGRGGYVEG